VPIQLYNTLTRSKVELKPRDEQNVRMYVCGPTVYDLAHIGNARPVVVFDVLYRLLRLVYEGNVTYVRNITDVDDKIIAAAKESGEDIDAVTARTTKAFHQDMAALGTLPPTHEPRATQYIEKMKEMIARLMERGHAYAANDHVLFSVPSMPAYGRLSRHNRQELIDGARVEVAPYKRDPADFVLWKPSTPEQPGWDSPWGYGRPGWHIECSAMSAAILGEHFDIHGGGQDLIFPHHENELAQSVCALQHPPPNWGEPFVNIWMHNGYVLVGNEKMSKSLGNFLTVRQLLEEGVRGEVIRLALLSAHYRQPLDIRREKPTEAKVQLDRFYGALRNGGKEDAPAVNPAESVIAALSDDLNTPDALAVLHEQATNLNKARGEKERLHLKGLLKASGAMLGLLQAEPEAWFKGRGVEIKVPTAVTISTSLNAFVIRSDQSIQKLIDERDVARKSGKFAEADNIRAKLESEGIILEDHPDRPTDWRRA
jgi:cysteinyl-tRNA synthetase